MLMLIRKFKKKNRTLNLNTSVNPYSATLKMTGRTCAAMFYPVFKFHAVLMHTGPCSGVESVDCAVGQTVGKTASQQPLTVASTRVCHE